MDAKKRNALPSSKFAMPESRKYPVNDRAHAANAKSRASQQEKAGNISESTKEKIDAAADRVLKPEGSKPSHGTSEGKGHWSGH